MWGFDSPLAQMEQIDDGSRNKKSQKDIEDTLNALLYFCVPGAGARAFSDGISRMAEEASQRAYERDHPDESKMRNVTPEPDMIEAPKEE